MTKYSVDEQTVADLQQVCEILDQRLYELKSLEQNLRSWVTISKLFLLRIAASVVRETM